MNEVDSMCKNVEYLSEKLQAVRASQGYQSQVWHTIMISDENNIKFNNIFTKELLEIEVPNGAKHSNLRVK